MNCKNCKNWVFGRCVISTLMVEPDMLCNAWELSLSWEQVAETQPVIDNTAELKVGGYFVDLEAERDSYRERCKELESRLDLYYGNAYDVVVDENAKLIARVAELEAEIEELKLENERLENAWLIDETIAPDGSLRPTVSNLLDRLNQTKTELEIANGTIDYLRNRIVRLEPYKSGYDANKEFPDDGENVIANVGTWLFLASYRDGKWYDSLGAQAEIRGGVDRWWKLPEVEE